MPRSHLKHKQGKQNRFPPVIQRLAVCLTLVAIPILSLCLERRLPKLQIFSTPDNSRFGKEEKTGWDACEGLRSRVVTIYAGPEIGAGSIVEPQGLVITNHHVVAPAGNGQIHITTSSQNFYTGQIVATDSVNDLALVKINTQDLFQTVPVASTNNVQPGQLICAIGSPFNRPGVITKGKLIGTRGSNDLRSKLYLNPGNSGGPLINAQGKLIGVNKSVWYLETGRNSGESFATNAAIAEQFIKQNRAKAISSLEGSSSSDQPLHFDNPTQYPFGSGAGMDPSPSPESRFGMNVDATLTIRFVEPNSGAEKAGLTGGDRLISVDMQPVNDLSELQSVLKQSALNRHPVSAKFTIERDQVHQQFEVLGAP